VEPCDVRSASTICGRDARSAGSTPQMRAVTTAVTIVKASTVPLIPIDVINGSFAGAICSITRMPMTASARPSAAPMAASSSVSVRSWRIRRPRVPPIAARMTSSR
jgi:hypothetical protein